MVVSAGTDIHGERNRPYGLTGCPGIGFDGLSTKLTLSEHHVSALTQAESMLGCPVGWHCRQLGLLGRVAEIILTIPDITLLFKTRHYIYKK